MEPTTVWTHENVEDHFNARYVAVAGFTLMIWTHLTTLDEEKTYIWSKDVGVTWNKSLFVAVRYISTTTFGFHCLTLFLAQPSPAVNELPSRFFGASIAPLRCQGLVISLGVAALGLIGACDVIFLLRTWAIYNRTRVSLICLSILLAITHLPTLVLGAIWMITTLHIGPSELYPVIPGCALSSTAPSDFWKVVVPSVIYNTVLSFASMYRIWSYHHRSLTTPVISLLIRDGIAYYVIIVAYLFNSFCMFHNRLIVVSMEGRFITWAVAVTCAQLQLNLRNAVYHVPGYITSYHQNRTSIDIPNDRRDPPRRPGLETIIFGGTATELERKRSTPSSGSENGEEGQHYSHDIELVTTSVHVPQGKKPKLSTGSADFGIGKRPPLSPPLGRTSFFQDSPSRSLRHNIDTTAIPNATEQCRPLSPTSNIQSEISSRSISRPNSSSARAVRVALGFDSKHNWALARPTSSSSATVVSPKPKKQIHGASQDGIPLEDTPSPRDMVPPLHKNTSGSAPDPDMRVEVQVECERDESGVALLPHSPKIENARRSGSQDGGIMETRIGMW